MAEPAKLEDEHEKEVAAPDEPVNLADNKVTEKAPSPELVHPPAAAPEPAASFEAANADLPAEKKTEEKEEPQVAAQQEPSARSVQKSEKAKPDDRPAAQPEEQEAKLEKEESAQALEASEPQKSL